ncbi:SLAM family member 9-like [Pelodytes ibericus]
MYRNIFYLSLLSSFLQHGVLCTLDCEDMKPIPGAEGGAVSLPVDMAGITDISWILGGRHIATTYPDSPIDIKAKKFKSKLSGTNNGSLHITQLSKAHEGIYTANIFCNTGKDTVQCYNLTVYRILAPGDIQILYITSQNKSCSLSMTCSVNGSDAVITWKNKAIGDSLVINHTLTPQDFYRNTTYICVAQNAISNTTIEVHPWTYCQETWEEHKASEKEAYWIIGAFVFILCLVSLLLWLLWLRRKKKGSVTNKQLRNCNCKIPILVKEEPKTSLLCPVD